MLTFACPECYKNHDWPDDFAGDRVDCPECGKLITLPRAKRSRRRDDDDDDYDDRRDDRDSVRRREREYEDEEDRDLRRIVKRRDYDDDDRYGDGSRREITCRRCDYVGRPDTTSEMAENAWLFIVLGLFFWPLIILGILMKQKWEVCPECRAKLRKIGGSTFG